MKQIHKMDKDELEQYAILLQGFSYIANCLSTVLCNLEGKSDNPIESYHNDVSAIQNFMQMDKYPTCLSNESFIRHMMRLCKNISVNLSYRFNELFGWTELDIYEVINGQV